MTKLKPIAEGCAYACYVIGSKYQQRQQQLKVWAGLSTSAHNKPRNP